MTLAFNGSCKRLQFRYVLSQILVRHTCKIAVEVDNELVRKLESNELKPRQHPGVSKKGRVELPSSINRALQRVIGDRPVKALLKDCKLLNQYISARHPPPEQDEMREKMREIVDKVNQRMPLENLKGLCEEEQQKWRQKRENAIKKLMAKTTYGWKPITYGAYEALVYAIGRGAMEYGVLMNILREVQSRDPDFKPRSYFDFGSGVGTGLWAASSLWQDSIFEYFNVDSSRYMHELSELILREGNENQHMTLRNVYYRQFLPAIETKYDLVVSAYSLFELPSQEKRKEVVLNLWQKCDGYLVLVEEGTRRGSELINEARTFIIEQSEDENLKGHVFAPCPHDSVCPRLAAIEDRTPCNFEVAYAPLNVDNEGRKDRLVSRYSYVVLKKGSPQDPTLKWPRLVRPTLPRSKHIICRMCTADAKLQEIIFTQSKHGRIAYRCAKAAHWGDRLPIAIGETYETEKDKAKKKAKLARQEAEANNTEKTEEITS